MPLDERVSPCPCRAHRTVVFRHRAQQRGTDRTGACGGLGAPLGTRSEWGLAAADGVNRHVIQLEMLDLNTIWYVQGRLLGVKVGVCRSFARRVCGASYP